MSQNFSVSSSSPPVGQATGWCFTCGRLTTIYYYPIWSGHLAPFWCAVCGSHDVEILSERLAEVIRRLAGEG